MKRAIAESHPLVIYSLNEACLNDGAGFWSGECGWVDLEESDRFTHTESQTLRLPMATGQDAMWLEAKNFDPNTGATSQKMRSFSNALGHCINCMLQEDARGEVLVFTRDGASLTTKKVGAGDLLLSDATLDCVNDLQQYEVILFDGGNSAGDSWKHIFFPQQLCHTFVSENPIPY